MCGSSRKSILVSVPYTDPRVWKFIETYYEGRVQRTDLVDVDYELAKCLECGFVWQANILSDEYMDILYHRWINPQHSISKKKHADVELYVQYSEELAGAIRYLKKRPFEIDILDFGMGWGYWCQMAKAFGCNSWGYEISPERIVFARSNGIEVIDNLDVLPSRKFDFINLEQVLEHVNKPRDLLVLLADSLRSNGLIHIGVPNGKSIEHEVGRDDWEAKKDAVQPLEHINCFTFESLTTMAESAGLTLVKGSVRSKQAFSCTWQTLLKKSLSPRKLFRKARGQPGGTSLHFRKRDGKDG